VKGRRVFGGVKRKYRKTFLVPVPERSAETFMAVLRDDPTRHYSHQWLLVSIPGHRISGYTHQTLNHTIGFVDVRTGAPYEHNRSTWRHVKALLYPYNHMGDYIYQLAHYMFAARYWFENMDQFTKLISIVATMDWRVKHPLHHGHVATYLAVAPFHTFVKLPPETCKICGTTSNIATSPLRRLQVTLG
jgi:hypothetical protein